MQARQPMGRPGTNEEIAEAIVGGQVLRPTRV
jgi:hypothetical protein